MRNQNNSRIINKKFAYVEKKSYIYAIFKIKTNKNTIYK